MRWNPILNNDANQPVEFDPFRPFTNSFNEHFPVYVPFTHPDATTVRW